MILYIDTNALIYSLTGKPEFKDPARNWLDCFGRPPGAVLVTSRLTILEALIGPLKQADAQRTSRIEAAFNGLVLLDIDDVTIRRAAAIRAGHPLRTPDAIHLAAALESRADVFLTADRRLKQFKELRVADVLRDDPEAFLAGLVP
ncbi:MAG: type II toxin-antitoxin system VapC family toxin [Vicinamibacteria bacterium]|nr:type II toxin-antitoxin system VapC family toxin [Vicinamibacteria bacterium]